MVEGWLEHSRSAYPHSLVLSDLVYNRTIRKLPMLAGQHHVKACSQLRQGDTS